MLGGNVFTFTVLQKGATIIVEYEGWDEARRRYGMIKVFQITKITNVQTQSWSSDPGRWN